ncbi:hypothetical protein HDU93_006612, partial [Gonapodya sp. JEL0774]
MEEAVTETQVQPAAETLPGALLADVEEPPVPSGSASISASSGPARRHTAHAKPGPPAAAKKGRRKTAAVVETVSSESTQVATLPPNAEEQKSEELPSDETLSEDAAQLAAEGRDSGSAKQSGSTSGTAGGRRHTVHAKPHAPPAAPKGGRRKTAAHIKTAEISVSQHTDAAASTDPPAQAPVKSADADAEEESSMNCSADLSSSSAPATSVTSRGRRHTVHANAEVKVATGTQKGRRKTANVVQTVIAGSTKNSETPSVEVESGESAVGNVGPGLEPSQDPAFEAPHPIEVT